MLTSRKTTSLPLTLLPHDNIRPTNIHELHPNPATDQRSQPLQKYKREDTHTHPQPHLPCLSILNNHTYPPTPACTGCTSPASPPSRWLPSKYPSTLDARSARNHSCPCTTTAHPDHTRTWGRRRSRLRTLRRLAGDGHAYSSKAVLVQSSAMALAAAVMSLAPFVVLETW
jgi:hypothetical protein